MLTKLQYRIEEAAMCRYLHPHRHPQPHPYPFRQRTAVLPALVLVGGLALGGVAGAGEVVKCTDAQGHLTLTDVPCAAAGVVLFSSTPPAAPAPEISAEGGYQAVPQAPDPLRLGAVRVHLAPAEFGPRGSARARYAHMFRPTVSEELRTDAATLRAARTTMSLSPAAWRQVASR
jgi:hypothetical protein